MMRVLSLGAGVQSSTLLLMACEGKLALDAAIFADTQWEPPAVYAHLDWLCWRAATAGIPVYRVTAGNLRADALAGVPEAWMPLYTRNADGSKSMLRRQCTSNYKITPIKRQLRVLGATKADPAVVVKGISWDEALRMRDPDVQYIRHEYPLVDQRITRADCKRWLLDHGYTVPPKSSCVGCPYRDNAAWRELQDQPDVWADGVAFDEAIRHSGRVKDAELFVHRRAEPLALVDLRTARDMGQMDLFGEECQGVCGV